MKPAASAISARERTACPPSNRAASSPTFDRPGCCVFRADSVKEVQQYKDMPLHVSVVNQKKEYVSMTVINPYVVRFVHVVWQQQK